MRAPSGAILRLGFADSPGPNLGRHPKRPTEKSADAGSIVATSVTRSLCAVTEKNDGMSMWRALDRSRTRTAQCHEGPRRIVDHGLAYARLAPQCQPYAGGYCCAQGEASVKKQCQEPISR